MANLNKVHLIGRLTRDPETQTLQSGSKVCRLGFVVNNRRRNQQTGEWEDEPVWLDLEAWNRQQGVQLADLLGELQKGAQLYIEGNLKLDQWQDKDTGQNRSKLKIVVQQFQYLNRKEEGQGGYSGRQQGGRQQAQQPQRPAPQIQRPQRPDPQTQYSDEPLLEDPDQGRGFTEEDIPF